MSGAVLPRALGSLSISSRFACLPAPYLRAHTGSTAGSTATVDGADCPPSGAGWQDSTLTCSLPAGQGIRRTVALKVGGQTATSTLFSYRRPKIDSVSPATSSTKGGVPLTLSGSSLGTSGAVTIGGLPATVTQHTHTQIVVTV